jgi:hypothetical protein
MLTILFVSESNDGTATVVKAGPKRLPELFMCTRDKELLGRAKLTISNLI